jgi:mannose-1-phosphate guanylyltransferase
MLEHLRRISVARGKSDFEQVFQQEFTAIKGVSIDYAVMEHARDVAVIEAPFEWDDVGSWQALARLQTADDAGNTVAALHMGLKTTGTIVRGPEDHLIVTLGVSDLIVVHTPDATLVANRHDEESVREIVRHLEERGWNQYL